MKKRNRKLIIYLADLTHTGIRIATDYMPLNIGIIASHILNEFDADVKIKLFKYPDKLFSALRNGDYDVLGCSTYIWNNNLSEFACRAAKKYNPGVLTVRGGWNFPSDIDQQEMYMRKHEATDIFCLLEGEAAFANVVRRILGVNGSGRWGGSPLGGCAFIDKKSGAFVSGGILPRMKNLSQIPSPYTTGLLDEFFDGKLIPMIETARGCPFTCSYCNSANDFYSKVEFFPAKYTADEIDYIAKRMKPLGMTNVMFADTNFGMYERDKEIAIALKNAQTRYGWPINIQATTGKNKVDKIIDILSILGNSLGICMSAQSMYGPALKAINRDNISLDMYSDLSSRLTEKGMSQMAELIVPLPEETYGSFMDGVRRLIELNAKRIIIHTLQINNGTIFKNRDFKKKFAYTGRFRLIPYDFGTYEGEKIFDYEEVGTFSSTLSFDEYRKIRKFSLVMELLINNGILEEVFIFLKEKGIGKFDFLKYAMDNLVNSDKGVRSVFESFVSDITAELIATEKGLVDFYSRDENYERIKSGELGGNVIFKHKGMMLGKYITDWVEYVFSCVRNILADGKIDNALSVEIEDIRSFILGKLGGLFDLEHGSNDIVFIFRHDVLRWLDKGQEGALCDFKVSGEGRRLRFYFDERQKSERLDLFLRYGSDMSGIAKLLARVHALERLYRKADGPV